MLIIHVHVHVKPETIDAFRVATIQNARQSVQEPGIIRFDVAQEQEDPSRFVLVEIYQDESAIEAHRATAHYDAWQAIVAPMMAEPRQRVRFNNVYLSGQNEL